MSLQEYSLAFQVLGLPQHSQYPFVGECDKTTTVRVNCNDPEQDPRKEGGGRGREGGAPIKKGLCWWSRLLRHEKMTSFTGQKELERHPDWSSFGGLNSSFPMSIRASRKRARTNITPTWVKYPNHEVRVPRTIMHCVQHPCTSSVYYYHKNLRQHTFKRPASTSLLT